MAAVAIPPRGREAGAAADITVIEILTAAYAVGMALALRFRTSLTEDPEQQSDQARILNELVERTPGHKLSRRLHPIP